jgi:thiol:disulfide interchange protein DsbC
MSLPVHVRRGVLVAVALGTAALAVAAPPLPPRVDAPKGDGRADIARRLDVPPEAVRPSAIAGLYEVAHGGEVVYVTTDGRYVIAGELYDSDKGKNLTSVRRAEARLETMKALSDDDAIIFTPKQPKYTLTVFTDVDCAYCRRLHADIAEYVRLGIRVRYMFYPRSGPGTDSWRKAEAVWCSANRQEALTRAKQGAEVPAAKAGCNTPVARTYAIGQELGMRGTPGIFTEHGEYVAGYLPAAQMVEKLKQLDAGGPG